MIHRKVDNHSNRETAYYVDNQGSDRKVITEKMASQRDDSESRQSANSTGGADQ